MNTIDDLNIESFKKKLAKVCEKMPDCDGEFRLPTPEEILSYKELQRAVKVLTAENKSLKRKLKGVRLARKRDIEKTAHEVNCEPSSYSCRACKSGTDEKISRLRGSVAFAERVRILGLLKSCCNEFNRGNWLYGRPPCNRNGLVIDKDRHCTMRGTCPVLSKLKKDGKI